MEKPKRPLSSFNLFYRYKRSLLTGQDISGEAVKNILTCPAGLEDGLLPSTSQQQQQQHQQQQQSKRTSKNIKPSLKTNELRRTKIRSALDGKILPSSDTKKRRHRKAANGPSISFVEMGRLMTESWKSVDPYARQVFDDLAGEGRKFYRDALEKYTEVGVTEEHDCGEPLRSSSKSKKTPSSRQKNEKVSVHKVSRCVKIKTTPIKSMNDMMFTRSKEPYSAHPGFGDGLGDGSLSRRRHVSMNPEDIARPLPQQTGGFAPVPEQTYGAITESMQLPFPPTSSQIGIQQLPQPHHRPRQMYHQQQYYQYHQRQQQRHTHDAHIPPHLAGGGGRSGDVAIGEHAGVDFLDDYAAYPIFQHDRGGELNLNNEDDIRTFFDT
eukprot:scaffold1167_cov108-Skeletonema_dohrnii-CCMP3373.AAC.9